MKIGFINSNIIDISNRTSKGTEIFCYILIRSLLRNRRSKRYSIKAFASGNSKLPVDTFSVTDFDLMSQEYIPEEEFFKFEQLLISKALSMQSDFDVFHFNMGNGELIIPFIPFIKKPVIITLHGPFTLRHLKEYFIRIPKSSNIHFVAISNSQRKSMPELNYIDTIHHGIDTKRRYKFSLKGGKSIMWAGRAVPEKGLDVVLQVVKNTRKEARLYMLTKKVSLEWLHDKILKQLHSINNRTPISSEFNLSRLELIIKYQTSKLFLFPIQWEEAFGLVLIESMGCGTPIVAYARGSVPEIVKDGVTGFLVNPSETDKRGDFIVKSTGLKGLCEAVERIYAMSDEEYQKMRIACREHAVNNYDITRMTNDYIDVYEKIAGKRSRSRR